MSELATDKQKKFMTDLGIEFDDDITKYDASYLISEELDKRDEVNGCLGPDWWKY